MESSALPPPPAAIAVAGRDQCPLKKPAPSSALTFKKTILCRYYPNCSRCSGCLFAHTVAELRARPDFTKTRICAAYLEGACSLPAGECSYAHGAGDLRTTTRVRGVARPLPRQVAPGEEGSSVMSGSAALTILPTSTSSGVSTPRSLGFGHLTPPLVPTGPVPPTLAEAPLPMCAPMLAQPGSLGGVARARPTWGYGVGAIRIAGPGDILADCARTFTVLARFRC